MSKSNNATRVGAVITFMGLMGLFVWGSLQTDDDGVPFVLIVFLGGFVGTGVNVTRDLHHHADSKATETLSLMSSLMSRLLVGGTLAVATYMLFLSGLVSGTLFPEFESVDYSGGFMDMAEPEMFSDFGKCMVWAFLAGYAERFTPGLLSPTK